MLHPLSVCGRCARTLQSSSRGDKLLRSSVSFHRSQDTRRISARQISLWSKWFPSKTEDASSTSTTTTEAKQSPEDALAEALQKAADERAAEIAAADKLIEEQLRAWGETDTNILDPPPPFQDPLGHLTFEQQKEYFANPPQEYLESLKARAVARENYEMILFQADPWTHWRLAGYKRKPDFSRTFLPRWRRWRRDQLDTAMEKFKRYDERFQRRVQSKYEKFDGEEYRTRVRNDMIASFAAATRAAKKAEKRTKKKKGKTGSADAKKEDDEVESGPPLAVIEHKVYRKVLRDRNMTLTTVWQSHLHELQKFENISEDGDTVSLIAMKQLGHKENKERNAKEVFGEWKNKPAEEKVQSVDWATIHKEL